VSTVMVHCVIETRDTEHAEALRRRLMSEGFVVSE